MSKSCLDCGAPRGHHHPYWCVECTLTPDYQDPKIKELEKALATEKKHHQQTYKVAMHLLELEDD